MGQLPDGFAMFTYPNVDIVGDNVFIRYARVGPVKRAGFALMAALAFHDKKEGDEGFLGFLPIIARESVDERNFVKKAVNWALRQIGKRSPALNEKAVEACREIQKTDSRSARWIASDALRELTSEAVQRRLQDRSKTPA
jgi:3-methyladenine DNA glycosylase AlkD